MPKTRIADLALFGGRPAFDEPLHVGRPNIGNRDRFLARINEMFDRRWLSNNGPFVQELEQRLAAFLEVKHCILICNATVALELTARALGLHSEVIIPSFTFIATAHALQWQGITPVFCDVDPFTHNIDPAKIESLITPRTTGILGVHVWGRACDVEKLDIIAKKHNLKLMFDAANAFGSSYRNKMIGGLGNAEIFSFHATKFFNTFEGGAITTNSDEVAENVRGMRNFGFVDIDQVTRLGTNGKMSEASAAMGLTSLESLDEFIQINKQNYSAYALSLADIPGIRLVTFNELEKNNYQYVVIEVDKETAGINRDLLVQVLQAENILARRYFNPGCHRIEPYRSLYPNAGLLLPETEKLTKNVMQLPTGTAVKGIDIYEVCGIIDFVIKNGVKILARMEGRALSANSD